MNNFKLMLTEKIIDSLNNNYSIPKDQLFFAINVKNNKLTSFYSAYIQAYNHAKYKICKKRVH